MRKVHLICLILILILFQLICFVIWSVYRDEIYPKRDGQTQDPLGKSIRRPKEEVGIEPISQEKLENDIFVTYRTESKISNKTPFFNNDKKKEKPIKLSLSANSEKIRPQTTSNIVSAVYASTVAPSMRSSKTITTPQGAEEVVNVLGSDTQLGAAKQLDDGEIAVLIEGVRRVGPKKDKEALPSMTPRSNKGFHKRPLDDPIHTSIVPVVRLGASDVVLKGRSNITKVKDIMSFWQEIVNEQESEIVQNMQHHQKKIEHDFEGKLSNALHLPLEIATGRPDDRLASRENKRDFFPTNHDELIEKQRDSQNKVETDMTEKHFSPTQWQLDVASDLSSDIKTSTEHMNDVIARENTTKVRGQITDQNLDSQDKIESNMEEMVSLLPLEVTSIRPRDILTLEEDNSPLSSTVEPFEYEAQLDDIAHNERKYNSEEKAAQLRQDTSNSTLGNIGEVVEGKTVVEYMQQSQEGILAADGNLTDSSNFTQLVKSDVPKVTTEESSSTLRGSGDNVRDENVADNLQQENVEGRLDFEDNLSNTFNLTQLVNTFVAKNTSEEINSTLAKSGEEMKDFTKVANELHSDVEGRLDLEENIPNTFNLSHLVNNFEPKHSSEEINSTLAKTGEEMKDFTKVDNLLPSDVEGRLDLEENLSNTFNLSHLVNNLVPKHTIEESSTNLGRSGVEVEGNHVVENTQQTESDGTLVLEENLTNSSKKTQLSSSVATSEIPSAVSNLALWNTTKYMEDDTLLENMQQIETEGTLISVQNLTISSQLTQVIKADLPNDVLTSQKVADATVTPKHHIMSFKVQPSVEDEQKTEMKRETVFGEHPSVSYILDRVDRFVPDDLTFTENTDSSLSDENTNETEETMKTFESQVIEMETPLSEVKEMVNDGPHDMITHIKYVNFSITSESAGIREPSVEEEQISTVRMQSFERLVGIDVSPFETTSSSLLEALNETEDFLNQEYELIAAGQVKEDVIPTFTPSLEPLLTITNADRQTRESSDDLLTIPPKSTATLPELVDKVIPSDSKLSQSQIIDEDVLLDYTRQTRAKGEKAGAKFRQDPKEAGASGETAAKEASEEAPETDGSGDVAPVTDDPNADPTLSDKMISDHDVHLLPWLGSTDKTGWPCGAGCGGEGCCQRDVLKSTTSVAKASVWLLAGVVVLDLLG